MAFAGACGAILAVIEALKAFPGHEQIVQIGVWSLGVLASLNADNALKIGKSGGITVILDSTKAWMKNPSTVNPRFPLYSAHSLLHRLSPRAARITRG